jgi:hypothetical protein
MSSFRSIALLGVTLLCPLLAQGGSRTLEMPITPMRTVHLRELRDGIR